ncbi:MAG: FIST signal transduction protein [Thiobacillaceae bacterium]
MHIYQAQLTQGAEAFSIPRNGRTPQLALLFASPAHFTHPTFLERLRKTLPNTQIVGCSTSGEISPLGVTEDSAVVSAITFDHTSIRTAHDHVENAGDSHGAGARLARALASPDLKAVFILAPGVDVNGSELIAGITSVVGKPVVLTGGLAGDNGDFKQTWQMHEASCSDRLVVGVGFYGDQLLISHGSFGGWQSFGPARLATRAQGNVLYALDDEPALNVYKRYLGEYATGLPASGLLFPFAILNDDRGESGLIRTLLGIDETLGSITLAGDVPQGSYLRLMHASTESLIDGAEVAARNASPLSPNPGPSLAILISCVGRKLVMGDHVEEEVEAVGSIVGPNCALTGFYSYGEISPLVGSSECRLHNQTMTITHLSESPAA